MSQIQVLPVHEVIQFEQPPRYTKEERSSVFSITVPIQRLLSSLKHDVSKVGLILQMGYFNSTHKFFTANKFRHADIYYVAKLLGVAVKPQTFIADYKDRTRNHHKLKILELMSYDIANHHEDFIEESIADLTSKQLHPRQILFSVIDLLIEKKIETPNYDYFVSLRQGCVQSKYLDKYF